MATNHDRHHTPQNLSTNHRFSLNRIPGTCWTDPACNRSLVVSHGGDWNLVAPYDSMLAFERAFENGADCVKGDFRVAQDDVGVVAHSSPILCAASCSCAEIFRNLSRRYYESPQCMGKRIENMTSTQVTECHLTVTSQTYITVLLPRLQKRNPVVKYVQVPHLLQWAQGKSIVMLCVKESRDIARAITTIIENNATDRTFLELRYLSPRHFTLIFTNKAHVNKAHVI
jgi:glycerophosphoryl diester phosphodiesterase